MNFLDKLFLYNKEPKFLPGDEAYVVMHKSVCQVKIRSLFFEVFDFKNGSKYALTFLRNYTTNVLYDYEYLGLDIGLIPECRLYKTKDEAEKYAKWTRIDLPEDVWIDGVIGRFYEGIDPAEIEDESELGLGIDGYDFIRTLLLRVKNHGGISEEDRQLLKTLLINARNGPMTGPNMNKILSAMNLTWI